MKNVKFYLLRNSSIRDDLNAVEQLACSVITKYWSKGNYIIVICNNKQQAQLLDEALWIKSSGRFIPHNLIGEGPRSRSVVDITWPQKIHDNLYDILINLNINFLDFCQSVKKVIDFVPCEESLKQLARERYKAYRMAGFSTNMAIWK